MLCSRRERLSYELAYKTDEQKDPCSLFAAWLISTPRLSGTGNFRPRSEGPPLTPQVVAAGHEHACRGKPWWFLTWWEPYRANALHQVAVESILQASEHPSTVRGLHRLRAAAQPEFGNEASSSFLSLQVVNLYTVDLLKLTCGLAHLQICKAVIAAGPAATAFYHADGSSCSIPEV